MAPNSIPRRETADGVALVSPGLNHAVGAAAAPGPSDPTWTRLEGQIDWYDRSSQSSKRWYEVLKSAEIVAAAAIPFSAGFQITPWVTGSLGVVVVVLEGFQQLKQFHSNWTSYRSTCEALKHEKFLYLGRAEHYASATNAHALLASRVEELVSREHAKWVDVRRPWSRQAEPPR